MIKNTAVFTKHREDLLRLADEDQVELIGSTYRIQQIKDQSKKDEELRRVAINCHIRANKMLEVLDEVKNPTIENIGEDGCEAVLVIAQHSYYLAMKRVLILFQRQLKTNPTSVPKKFIPALTDRVMTIEERKQLYGTQWTGSLDKNIFLIRVKDFKNVNKRRKEFGLGPVMRPVNLAKGAEKYPLGKGLAISSDQKDLTDEEYNQRTRFMLRCLV